MMNSRRTASCSASRAAIALYDAASARSSAGPSSGTRASRSPSAMRAAAAAIRSSGRARRRASAIARTRATTAATSAATPNTMVTLWSNISRAWSALAAGGHHQRLERRRADPQDPDADDRQRDPGDDQRRDQDPRGQPVAAAHRGPARRATGIAAR